MLFSISVTLSGNIIRSAILAGNITSDCGPIAHHNILAGNITSDCGPLGRHNRATMFRAYSVPYVAVDIISMSAAETKSFVPVNSLIHAKSDV